MKRRCSAFLVSGRASTLAAYSQPPLTRFENGQYAPHGNHGSGGLNNPRDTTPLTSDSTMKLTFSVSTLDHLGTSLHPVAFGNHPRG